VTNPIEDKTRDEATTRRIKIIAGVALALGLVAILCIALGVPLWVVAMGIGVFLLIIIFEA